MLINEAKWIGEAIRTLPLEGGSVFLNFGSQSEEYNKKNIHIEKYLLKPIRENHSIKNLDLKPGKGIDFAGDLYEDVFFGELKKQNFDCILLCNVLEHVEQIEPLCRRLSDLLDKNGIIIFSGPYHYPIHYDPIDNGFRPTIDEVVKLFPDFKLINSDIVIDYTYSYYLLKDYKLFITTLLRVFAPFYRFKKWKKVVLPKFNYWNKKFNVTCVIIQKINE
jgi:SAM-dependent methyltransferase